MKIVLLVDSLHSIAAGSERQIFKLAEGLVNSGHELRLLVLRHTTFTRGNQFVFPCPVESLDIRSLLSWSAIKKMAALRCRLRNDQTDVVHAYFPDASLFAPLFLGGSQMQIITSRRDMGLIYKGKPSWLYRILAPRTDQVIANSSAVASLVQETEKLKAAQSCVIYNGIEDYAVSGHKQEEQIFNDLDAIKLILVANIKPVKRTLDAVVALQNLIQSGHKVELALAGEKQDRDYVTQIEQTIESQNLTPFVHWLGQVNEPRRLLDQADIGLLISDSEGLSNAIMEYMQMGLPVIATNVGGNPELVAHEQNGLLIGKGDISGLVASILRLDQNRTLLKQYGDNGKARIVHEFSISAMIKNHERVYSRSN